MVKQPLDGIQKKKKTIKIFHIIMGKRSCMHVIDPVVNVRVQWIMEMLKYPAQTVGWVAQLAAGF